MILHDKKCNNISGACALHNFIKDSSHTYLPPVQLTKRVLMESFRLLHGKVKWIRHPLRFWDYHQTLKEGALEMLGKYIFSVASSPEPTVYNFENRNLLSLN